MIVYSWQVKELPGERGIVRLFVCSRVGYFANSLVCSSRVIFALFLHSFCILFAFFCSFSVRALTSGLASSFSIGAVRLTFDEHATELVGHCFDGETLGPVVPALFLLDATVVRILTNERFEWVHVECEQTARRFASVDFGSRSARLYIMALPCSRLRAVDSGRHV